MCFSKLEIGELVIWYPTQSKYPNCVSPFFSSLPVVPEFYRVVFTSVLWSMHVRERAGRSAHPECTLDRQYPFQFCCSKLITENVFRVISGTNTIVVLAHTDHKPKKKLSSTKGTLILSFSTFPTTYLWFTYDNCRFQMSEAPPPLWQSRLFSAGELSSMYIHSNALIYRTLQLPHVWEPYKVVLGLQKFLS